MKLENGLLFNHTNTRVHVSTLIHREVLGPGFDRNKCMSHRKNVKKQGFAVKKPKHEFCSLSHNLNY